MNIMIDIRQTSICIMYHWVSHLQIFGRFRHTSAELVFFRAMSEKPETFLLQVVFHFFFSNKRMKHGYWNKNKKIKHWTQACKKKSNLGRLSWKLYNKMVRGKWCYIDTRPCPGFINLQNNWYLNTSEQRIKLLIWNIKLVGWNKIL